MLKLILSFKFFKVELKYIGNIDRRDVDSDFKHKKSFLQRFWPLRGPRWGWIGLGIITLLVIVVVIINPFKTNLFDQKDQGEKTDNGNPGSAEETKQNDSAQPTSQNNNSSSQNETKLEVYPETSDAPVLHMYWNTAKTANIPPSEVKRIGRFGLWEGSGGRVGGSWKAGHEPATETEIHTYNQRQPVFALAKGIVTDAKIDNEGAGTLAVRYGENYAIQYFHVMEMRQDLKLGTKIEPGDLLGYTRWMENPGQPAYGFWEAELDKKVGDNARAIPIVDYFDTESKESLDKLLVKVGLTSWVVDLNDKDAGWVDYVGKPEGWANGQLLGLQHSDQPKDYYQQFGLSDIFADN